MSSGFIFGIIVFVLLVIVGNILLLKSNTSFQSTLTERNKQEQNKHK